MVDKQSCEVDDALERIVTTDYDYNPIKFPRLPNIFMAEYPVITDDMFECSDDEPFKYCIKSEDKKYDLTENITTINYIMFRERKIQDALTAKFGDIIRCEEHNLTIDLRLYRKPQIVNVKLIDSEIYVAVQICIVKFHTLKYTRTAMLITQKFDEGYCHRALIYHYTSMTNDIQKIIYSLVYGDHVYQSYIAAEHALLTNSSTLSYSLPMTDYYLQALTRRIMSFQTLSELSSIMVDAVAKHQYVTGSGERRVVVHSERTLYKSHITNSFSDTAFIF